MLFKPVLGDSTVFEQVLRSKKAVKLLILLHSTVDC